MAGSLTIDTLKAGSGVLATQNGMTGIAKAWVYFNGSTAAINASFNVSSITKVSTGYYTINMTTALPTSTYAIAGSARETVSNGVGIVVNCADLAAPTTSTFRIQVIGGSSFAPFDSLYTSVAVFSS
jgi:hypothetical protein